MPNKKGKKTAKSKSKSNKRKTAAKSKQNWMLWVAKGMAVILVGGALFFMGQELYRAFLRSSYFRVSQVQILNGQRVGKAEVLKWADINPAANVFTLNLKEISKKIEAHPWIRSVRITRRLPNKLIIVVSERKPVALLKKKKLFFFDSEGVLFKEVRPGDEFDYPVITGVERPVQEIYRLLEMSGQSQILPGSRISEIHMDKDQGLTFYTTGETIQVKLGRGDLSRKWSRLETILKNTRKRELLPQTIDLDYKDLAVVRLSSGQESFNR